jgi:hypothetical protein
MPGAGYPESREADGESQCEKQQGIGPAALWNRFNHLRSNTAPRTDIYEWQQKHLSVVEQLRGKVNFTTQQ